MIKLLRIFTVFLVFVSFSYGYADKPPLPSSGVIPDEITAVKVAEVIFLPIYGKEEVNKFLPYHAQFKDGVWTVYGTLKPNSVGGTPQLKIQKKDGKVIEVWHSL